MKTWTKGVSDQERLTVNMRTRATLGMVLKQCLSHGGQHGPYRQS